MFDGSKIKYECIHISIHKKVNSKNVNNTKFIDFIQKIIWTH